MSRVRHSRITLLLIMFGTSVEHALPGLLHIRDRAAARFSQARVRMVFSSRIIRRIWHRRGGDRAYRVEHPEIPEEIFTISGPREAMAGIGDRDGKVLLVQPVQIAPVEDTLDADRFLGECGPDVVDKGKGEFAQVIAGRPAMGAFRGNYPYQDDLQALAKSLRPDVDHARKEKAALYYLGHGNTRPATARVYLELLQEIRSQYPDICVVMSLIEGDGSIEQAVAELKQAGAHKVVLKPFMIVAGDHVRKDMVGNREETISSCLERQGLSVIPVFAGLGDNTQFADIFVRHIADAARDAGIDLDGFDDIYTGDQ